MFPFLLGSMLSACTAAAPVVRETMPSPPPRVQKIPGTPVVLQPHERALGDFLKGQVALTRGDYDTALSAFAKAVERDPNTPFLRFRLPNRCARRGSLIRYF